MSLITERAELLNYFDNAVFGIDFEAQALATFRYQYKYNVVYQQYCKNLKVNINNVTKSSQIPFLPISAFKHHEIKTGEWLSQEVFLSSGTTHNVLRSKHSVRELEWYWQNTEHIWDKSFGSVSDYCILALLPGYLERDGSSLISMVHHFIGKSNYSQSGFYIREHSSLYDLLIKNIDERIPTVLFGVSYALLDFVENYTLDYPALIVIETGGMKGQRPEMIKSALHEVIARGFDVPKVYSEYGMTELLSQCYSTGQEKFAMHSRMKVIITQIYDPLSIEKNGKSGIVNVIDLANIDTCAFIQTQDIGIDFGDDHFSILGRLDASDIRGCNLMVDEL
jgi:Acyl-protein synthetase, LuxE